MPRVVPVNADRPDDRAVVDAADVLRSGGLVGLPTETVYGLGARLFDERALERIFRAKGRPAHHPLIAHVIDERQARDLASHWPEEASRLAAAFWPGPLTLVVARASHVPPAVAGGAASVAVRSPSHRVARAVIAAVGEPVAAPSANRYQGVSPTTAAHVVKELGDAVDLVLDAGPCAAGIESTVLDIRGGGAQVLRPGAIDLETLRGVVPQVEVRVEPAGANEERASPGLDARHYSPRATLLIGDTAESAARLAESLSERGRRTGLVARRTPAPLPGGVVVRQLPDEPAQYGRLLYSTLHDLDDRGVEVIVVQAVPDGEPWRAIADRLRRARG